MGLTAVQVANVVLPLTYTDSGRVVVAAGAVAELVRRLNHATVHPQALPSPADIVAVVDGVDSALWGVEQLLVQVAKQVDRFAGDLRLIHVGVRRRRGRLASQLGAVGTAQLAAAELRRAAAARWGMTNPLQTALEVLGHLRLAEHQPAR